MKILVTVKRVPDPETSIKVKPDGIGHRHRQHQVGRQPVRRDRHRGGAAHQGEGRAAPRSCWSAIGPKVAQEQLRTGLAMGADRAILVVTDDDARAARGRARARRRSSRPRSPTSSLMGKQAIDDDSNAVGQMLAELLGWPQATFASKVELAGDQKSATVTREVDGGLETLELPAARRSSPPTSA